ncbi:unnamed protein product [Anisakis simplex]|uniref:G-patch domain-containing protein n=1 Tax=Anisakis simplex TaxID=6269 RepID=A0A158PN16_ANISI|nr:unnamed protein product [Anisakis simplex]
MSEVFVYALLRNIPNSFHSKDLRRYFADYVESNKFSCFHFRHRPEIQREGDGQSDVLSEADIKSLIELKPPSLMPHGNIGTSSQFLREQIRLCKLPPRLISKLGIQSKRSTRKFGSVPFDYDTNQPSTSAHQVKRQLYKKRKECDVSIEQKVIEREEPDNDDGSDNDDDQCEEWERHEANYEDVTEQERTKPRKYEEELEVTWEKGGPGLVWYTDVNYWRDREEGTDCDWKWHDDWDVDYSIYYDDRGGDRDAVQSFQIREDQKLRSGDITRSCFGQNKNDISRKRRRRLSDSEIGSKGRSIGEFERYSKGVGSVVMKRFGWEPGKGLGRDNSGRVEAICEELGSSQLSGDRRGFGYFGEKLNRKCGVISSTYDKPDDSNDNVKRRNEPSYMKYNSFQFSSKHKATGLSQLHVFAPFRTKQLLFYGGQPSRRRRSGELGGCSGKVVEAGCIERLHLSKSYVDEV